MNHNPLIRTKILLPRRPTHLLTRPRLLGLFDDLLDHKLTLITAPAGYGKTSVLIDLAHQIELPVCWYTLDVLDQDPQRFVKYLIASIAQRFPNFGDESTAVLRSMTTISSDPDTLVQVVVSEACEHIREHFVLVLDDYHLVAGNETINHFVNRFVQRVDENFHLILASRTLLTLPDLPLMVARSQVGGLGFKELAFRADEIQQFMLLNNNLTIPEPVAEELVRETEGWITGLLLSAQTMWQGMVDRVRVARVSGVGLYDYLAQQVLDQQPAAIRDFLLQTSLLEEFDAGLCEAVLGPGKNWHGLIDDVLQRHLFVLPVENRGTWLRYHHLFRDFLQARLAQERQDERERILRRLSDVHSEREEWEEAYAVGRRLNDVEATADLIDRAGTPLMKSGRLTTLAEWIDDLPAEVVASRPGLLSVRGDVAVMLGQVEQGMAWLNQAEAALRMAGDLPRLVRTLVRRTVAHRFLGQYQESLVDADEALTLAEQDESLHSVRAGALRARGMGLYHMGRANAAIEWLERSLAAYIALCDEQSVALLHMELGMTHMSTGRYDLAMEHNNRALIYWQQTSNPLRQAPLFNNLGMLHHLSGDYEQALTYLDQALSSAQKSGFARMKAVVFAGMGDLYADLNAPKSAWNAYRQAHEIAREMDDRLLRYLALVEAALARLEGDLHQACQRLETAGQLVQQSGSSYEEGMWQLETGRLALAKGDAPGAAVSLEKSIRHFDEGGQRSEAARAHLLLAAAHHSAGERGAARNHLEQALMLAAKLESQHTLVVAGREAKTLLDAMKANPTVGRQASGLLRRVIQFERDIPVLRSRLRRQTSVVSHGPPRMAIQTLGRTQVTLGGKPITAVEWRWRKAVRDLFFLLLAHPAGFTKEGVGVILWPDSSPVHLKLQFKNAIYRLRRALGQDVILFDENLYRFNRALDHEYDVEVLLNKLSQAQTAADPVERMAAYREAVDLYHGPYLPEAEGAWVWPERERLRQAYVEAVSELAEYHLRATEYEVALNYCRHALSKDPCLEEVHRQAIRAHAARGDRAAVVHQYERCRQALLEEVGIHPSPRTEALYETLTH